MGVEAGLVNGHVTGLILILENRVLLVSMMMINQVVLLA